MKRIFFRARDIRVLHQNYCTVSTPYKVFSAIQPTGEAHLGNYLGALRKWVDIQNSEKYSLTFAIADLHSITIPKDPKELQNNILLMAATLLACGIDSDKSIFFKQSDVKQHAELCWTLATMTTMARLAQLPQYKEKSKLFKDIPVGIFLYPVLQAADIMLYRATHVPVGEDQIQQIYFAQHIIKLFNNRFGSSFPVPDFIIDSTGKRIKSLADPSKKMSKSELRHTATISLMDEPDAILKKLKKSVTDFQSELTFEPEKRPGVSNLITIHSGLTGKTPQDIIDENANLDTGKYKMVLADVIIEHLRPIKRKITEYLGAEEYLISELEKGAEKAEAEAEKTMKEVKERIGMDLLRAVKTQEISNSVNH